MRKNKRDSILYIYDQPGWIFYFRSQTLKKYSNWKIFTTSISNIEWKDFRNIKLVIIPSWSIYVILRDSELLNKIKNAKIKILVKINKMMDDSIIINNKPSDLLRLEELINISDFTLVCSLKQYNLLTEEQKKKCSFLPNFVDTNIFYPFKEYHDFTIGWAGNSTRKEKRFDIISQCNYQIKIKDDKSPEYLYNHLVQEDMLQFYNSIDLLIHCSEKEGTPSTMLEAMACGKPILISDVGIGDLVLNKEWVIKNSDDLVTSFNSKLKLLKSNIDILIKEGKRNREFIKKNLSWSNNIWLVDEIFFAVISNNLNRIFQLTEPFFKLSPDSNLDFSNIKRIFTKKINYPKKIYKIGDRHGWAFHFIAKEQSRYTKHNQDYYPINDLEKDIIKDNPDLYYFYNPSMAGIKKTNDITTIIKKENKKIIGGYGGNDEDKYTNYDLIGAVDLRHSKKLSEIYGHNVIFLPEGIDTKDWRPNKIDYNRFNVGWVGKYNHWKRGYLLEKISYPVKAYCNRNPEVFTIHQNLEPMKEFYKDIDLLIVLSKHEAMPRVILEAMACGIPVLSTDVGSVPLLLEKEWLVKPENELEVVEFMNKNIDLFRKHPILREEVGKRNRKWIEKYFSWEKIQPYWDNLYNYVLEEKDIFIIEQHNEFLKQFKDVFPIEEYLIGSNYKLINQPIIKKIEPNLIINVIEKKIEQKITESVVIPIQLNSLRNEKISLLSELQNRKIIFWFLKESCFEAVVNERLSENNKLCLGTLDENNKKIIIDLAKIFAPNIEINIIPEQRMTKDWSIEELKTKVPMPVVSYLENYLQKTWTQIQELKENKDV